MSGCWVTWPADVTIRADVPDVRQFLAQGVELLSDHSDIDDADYEYDPWTATVSFTIRVRWGISEVFVRRQALDALHDCLPAAGLATSRRGPTLPATIAWLEFTRWPSDFQWW